MKIILDAMGGDNAPQAVVQGALEAHAQCGADIVLVGREEAIRACLTGPLPEGVEIVNATEVVEMCDDPATAFKRKKDSSLTVGLTMLKNGEGDAFISAGSTGALLAGATLLVKRIRGVRRAAMGPVIPTATGHAILCDCGANADCTPEYLLQFAYMGSFYCQKQMKDQFHMLDEKLIFSNSKTGKKDYASKMLNYPLEQGEANSYDKLMSVLYSPAERHKIEWAIGSVVSGDSKRLQKFMVLYGAAGTGKSTVLNIIQQLFDGYYSVFDAKALGSSSNAFALEAFKTNPLVAIQHDGDLSRIEDNTRLNSLVSHEL